jgi:hypothetical protein
VATPISIDEHPMKWPAWCRRGIVNYLTRYDKAELVRLFDPQQPVTGAGNYFLRLGARALRAEEVFSLVYAKNLWGVDETRSGAGSTMTETAAIRTQLPVWFRQYHITSLLDIPCGDFNWMRGVDLSGVLYTGADIVPELIAGCAARHAAAEREFVCLNLLADPLPTRDAVLCRDCLVHLPHADVLRALANIRASGARYLLATTFPSLEQNEEVTLGFWRPINLERPPFSLPPPVALLHEGNPDGRYADKSLGLWRVADLTAG